MSVRKIIDFSEIARALEEMANDLATQYRDVTSLIVVGIADGGITASERLAHLLETRLQRPIATGTLNVVFQRDDIGRNPIPKESIETHLPDDVDDATILLVDDVIAHGRTIRAALNQMSDYGRPHAVRLAVLIDRGGRQLPIRADFVGKNIPAASTDDIVVTLKESGEKDAVLLAKS